jgi:hypothetical protein
MAGEAVVFSKGDRSMAQIANPDPTPEDDNENDRPNYYLWAAVITLSLLALPETRLQSIFKMAVWTVIVLGVLTPMIWPFVRDTLSRFIFAMICIVHFLLMRIVYARLPQDGYIAIGFVSLVELVVFSVPAGWLKIRSSRIE